MGDKRNRQCIFTIKEEKEIIKEYESGKGAYILGEKYKVDASTIYNILKVYNVRRRTLRQARNTNITLNENCFDPQLDSPEMAYWLGVLFSDGYLSCTKNYTSSFGISVKESDKDWLEQLKQYTGYNGSVHIYTQVQGYNVGSQYARLIIGNNKIVEDLKKWGMQENKSLKPFNIPETEYKINFIHGYIDGNGSIQKRSGSLYISGQRQILQDIAEYFQLPFNMYPDKSIFNLLYSPNNAKLIFQKIIQSSSQYHLKRKYDLMSINQ